jgi:hypothetical protein
MASGKPEVITNQHGLTSIAKLIHMFLGSRKSMDIIPVGTVTYQYRRFRMAAGKLEVYSLKCNYF